MAGKSTEYQEFRRSFQNFIAKTNSIIAKYNMQININVPNINLLQFLHYGQKPLILNYTSGFVTKDMISLSDLHVYETLFFRINPKACSLPSYVSIEQLGLERPFTEDYIEELCRDFFALTANADPATRTQRVLLKAVKRGMTNGLPSVPTELSAQLRPGGIIGRKIRVANPAQIPLETAKLQSILCFLRAIKTGNFNPELLKETVAYTRERHQEDRERLFLNGKEITKIKGVIDPSDKMNIKCQVTLSDGTVIEENISTFYVVLLKFFAFVMIACSERQGQELDAYYKYMPSHKILALNENLSYKDLQFSQAQFPVVYSVSKMFLESIRVIKDSFYSSFSTIDVFSQIRDIQISNVHSIKFLKNIFGISLGLTLDPYERDSHFPGDDVIDYIGARVLLHQLRTRKLEIISRCAILLTSKLISILDRICETLQPKADVLYNEIVRLEQRVSLPTRDDAPSIAKRFAIEDSKMKITNLLLINLLKSLGVLLGSEIVSPKPCEDCAADASADSFGLPTGSGGAPLAFGASAPGGDAAAGPPSC